MMNAPVREMMPMFSPSADTARALRESLSRFATGVTIVTCASEHGPLGITANSFTSISLDPALVMWAVGNSSKRAPAFIAAQHFSIHVLGADQEGICQTIAKDGFALRSLPHDINADGVPVIPGSLARYDCIQFATHEAGDHTMIVGKVVLAGHRSGAGLAFFDGKFAKIEQP